MDHSSCSSRRRLPSPKPVDHRLADHSRESSRKLGPGAMNLTKTFTTLVILLAVLFAFSMMAQYHPSQRRQTMGFADARVLEGRDQPNVTQPRTVGLDETFQPDEDSSKDKLLGGLLASGFDEDSCRSRHESALYRKPSPYKPSSYLISKLRSYEMRHKRCGPGTEPYKKAVEQLNSSHSTGSSECNYIVWVSFSGLGNRILSLASAFLYALLTDRVLLVDRGKDMDQLFCEPFLGASWLLPLDFPLTGQFNEFGRQSERCYGHMLKNNMINESTESVPSYLYLHLVHDYGDHDKMFFCDGDQAIIRKVPWLFVKTDNYFVPSLFLMPGFEDELSKLFPQKETVFHHLGRYLFHPTNQVWGLITRYHQTHLARADEKIGIQVRVFEVDPGPFQHVMDQIISCTQREKLLPDIDRQRFNADPSENPKLTSVLVTSLSAGYSENLQNMYWEHPTVSGDVIGVHQPSHEGYQQTEKHLHNEKALAEMYLLSLTDKLVTSAWSTFGYVAQGLGGLTPWILYKPENRTTPDPPCRRVRSLEPCFHAPPYYDCKAKTGTDTGNLVPHVRHCEDMSWGLKVVDRHPDIDGSSVL